jgi:hypothetical protein
MDCFDLLMKHEDTRQGRTPGQGKTLGKASHPARQATRQGKIIPLVIAKKNLCLSLT